VFFHYHIHLQTKSTPLTGVLDIERWASSVCIFDLEINNDDKQLIINLNGLSKDKIESLRIQFRTLKKHAIETVFILDNEYITQYETVLIRFNTALPYNDVKTIDK
jgi:hypothetical protein